MTTEGVIVSYNSERGFGFIKSATVERDLFFHVSEFREQDVPRLGMRVGFDVKAKPDGKTYASNIHLVQIINDARLKNDPHHSGEQFKEISMNLYSAAISLREGSDSGKFFYGTLKLNKRQLHFEGGAWLTGKAITRSLRLITSVEKSFFGPYVIAGGGPRLYVRSTRFFATDELDRLIGGLRELI